MQVPLHVPAWCAPLSLLLVCAVLDKDTNPNWDLRSRTCTCHSFTRRFGLAFPRTPSVSSHLHLPFLH